MKLEYFSCYPFNDPKAITIRDEERGDLEGRPFRLYHAATCESIIDFKSEEDFVRACYEAMDRPDCRIDDYKEGEPYEDIEYGVKVIPTKHFYGATNTMDGIFCSDKSVRRNSFRYVKSFKGFTNYPNWYSALLDIYKYRSDSYATKLVDFEKYYER